MRRYTKKAALHEKEAAYEKLKILLQKNEEDARDLREEMDRTNKVLQTQLLAAEMENKRLLNDLSDTRKQNERLQEALKQANDTNSAGLDTPTVRSNNSQTETAHVLTNGMFDDDDHDRALVLHSPTPSFSAFPQDDLDIRSNVEPLSKLIRVKDDGECTEHNSDSENPEDHYADGGNARKRDLMPQAGGDACKNDYAQKKRKIRPAESVGGERVTPNLQQAVARPETHARTRKHREGIRAVERLTATSIAGAPKPESKPFPFTFAAPTSVTFSQNLPDTSFDEKTPKF